MDKKEGCPYGWDTRVTWGETEKVEKALLAPACHLKERKFKKN